MEPVCAQPPPPSCLFGHVMGFYQGERPTPERETETERKKNTTQFLSAWPPPLDISIVISMKTEGSKRPKISRFYSAEQFIDRKLSNLGNITVLTNLPIHTRQQCFSFASSIIISFIGCISLKDSEVPMLHWFHFQIISTIR